MKKLFVIIFLILSFSSFAQTELDFCAYDNNLDPRKYPWKGNNQFLLDYIKKYPAIDSGQIYFRVPICIHYFKDKRVPDRIIIDDLKLEIYRLNKIYAFNNTGIFFYLSEINFYDNRKHFVASYYTEAPFISNKNKHPYSINVYYVRTLQSSFLKKKKTYRGVYNPLTNSITVMTKKSSSTLAHEIGHYFGLKHPHQNWKSSKLKQESVSRTRRSGFLKTKLNCETNGDFLADTPAEPDLNLFSDSLCKYTGADTILDHWGDPYTPNTNNIMSYTNERDCRDNFTLMQRAAMLYTAENDPNAYLWKNCKSNIQFTADNYEPDDYIYQYTELQTDIKQYHTFHMIPSRVKNKYLPNNTDWLRINADFVKINPKINISRANNEFPILKISCITPAFDTLSVDIVKNDTTITIDNFGTPVYIKIENLSQSATGKLFDYYIFFDNY